MKEWGGLAIAGEKIEGIADSLKKLSKCFLQDFQVQKKLSRQQKEQIFDNVCASLCHGCEQEKRCKEYYSYDNFYAAMQLLQRQEEAGTLSAIREESMIENAWMPVDIEKPELEKDAYKEDLEELSFEEDLEELNFEEILEKVEEQKEEQSYEESDKMPQDLTQAFLERCIHLEDFMYAASEEFIMAGHDLQFKNRIAEVRMLAGRQLFEVSSILKDFSEAIGRGKKVEQEYSNRLSLELRKYHVEMEDAVFLENANGMIQLLLTVRSKWGGLTAMEIAEAAGRAIGKKMRPEGNGTKILTDRFEVIHLSQDMQFRIFTGIARTAKRGSLVSGDTFSVSELPDAKMALMLSDGMGSGIRAQQESCMIIELLEEFLETGFSVKAAMRMVNALFLTNFQNSSAVTADVILLNLYNGIAEFYKAGAAPAYLKRGNTIISVCETALPAGMFFQEEEIMEQHKLYQGDYLIMITDGVLEALHAENKEQMMEGYLSMLSVRNPQEMADRILKFALEHEEDGPHDDMTVLVAAVYENHKKKRRLF